MCNYASVCGSPIWQVYGRTNGDLLREDLSHMLCLPGLLLPEPPIPAAGHCQPRSLQKTLRHSQAGLAQSLVGVTTPLPWVLVCTSFCFCLQESLVGTGFDFNMTVPVLPSYCDFSFFLGQKVPFLFWWV